MGIKTFAIGRTRIADDSNVENALEELKERLQAYSSYGDEAPDSTSIGNLYLRHGAATDDPVDIYIKNSSRQWLGSIGKSASSNVNLVDDSGVKIPIVLKSGRVYDLALVDISGLLIQFSEGNFAVLDIRSGAVYIDNNPANGTYYVTDNEGLLIEVTLSGGLVYISGSLANTYVKLWLADGELVAVRLYNGRIYAA